MTKIKKNLKTKECVCGEKVGLKTKTCKKCQHRFTFERVIIGESKRCPDCNTQLKIKARICYKCRYKYPKTHKKKKFEIIKNWKQLKKGQYFYAKGGPYYQLETDGQILKKGDRVPMGYKGKCVVDHVEKTGIKIYNGGGYGFLYMGPKKISEKSGITLIPHKIYKKL